MAGKDQFEGRTRARVGRSGSGVGMIAALVGAGLLLLLVLAGSLDAPADLQAVAILPPTAAPTATPPSVLPSPAPRRSEGRLYLATRAGEAASVEAFDLSGEPAFSVAGSDFALSADYGTLFVAGPDSLSAGDAGDGTPLWRVLVPTISQSGDGRPAPIIPRPDGFAVGLISEERLPDGGNATYFTFRQLDARTGAPLSDPFALEGWNGSDPLFFSADSRRLVVPGRANNVLLLDPGTGQRVGELSGDEATIAIWPLPNVDSFVWVTAPAVDRAVSADHGVSVALHNRADFALSDRFWAELPARHWPTTLVAADRDRQLVLRLLEEPADAADLSMAALTNKLAVIDLQPGRAARVLTLERQATALAIDPISTELYAAYAPAGGGGEIVRFDPLSYAATPLAALPAAEVVRMAIGPGEPVFVNPPLPPNGPPFFPTARPLDPPPFDRGTPITPALPMPLIEPLTRTTIITISAEIGHGGKRIFTAQGERIGRNGEVAWLSVPTMAGFDVISVDTGGASTVRARGVSAAVPRPGGAPWLLLRQPGGWALRDLANQRDQPLQLAADLELRGCVADPAGLRLACQSSPDTLAIITVADGASASVPLDGALRGGLPLAWTDLGIYGYSLAGGTRMLWLVPPEREPAPLPLLAGAEADRFAIAADRIIYTADWELRAHSLGSGDHSILAQGLDPASGMFSLSPDGRRVAYARPAGAGAYDLVVADLDAGEQAVLGTDQAIVAYSWRWTPAGDRLGYRVLEPPDSPQRERLVVIDAAAGDRLGDLALPGHTVAGAEFGPGGALATLIYEGMQADVLLLAPDGRRLRLGLDYPLGTSRPTLLYVP